MATKSKAAKASVSGARREEHDDPGAVAAFLRELKHPMKPVIESIRETILAADKGITEGIKWNTASFFCHGWFATIGVHAKSSVQIVMHCGAKVRDVGGLNETIADPSRLLIWLGQDRAILTLASAEDFKGKQSAFQKLIKQWVGYQRRLAGKK